MNSGLTRSISEVQTTDEETRKCYKGASFQVLILMRSISEYYEVSTRHTAVVLLCISPDRIIWQSAYLVYAGMTDTHSHIRCF